MTPLVTRLAAATLALTALAFPAQAVEVSLDLSLSGDIQHYTSEYECEAEGEDAPEIVTVEYINAVPNFLAILEIEDEPRIFVSVIAASGVRYASGQYVWWTRGAEAFFINEMDGPDAEPRDCIELTETP